MNKWRRCVKLSSSVFLHSTFKELLSKPQPQLNLKSNLTEVGFDMNMNSYDQHHHPNTPQTGTVAHLWSYNLVEGVQKKI